jgi:hypothetical protein
VTNGVDLTAIFPGQPYVRRIFAGGTGTVVARTARIGRLVTMPNVYQGTHAPDAQYTAIASTTTATSLMVGK